MSSCLVKYFMKILHLRHNQIDRIKWDSTIAQSLCDLPYAYSWYLDVVCPMWEALATEDYAYVMPLPLKQKRGIRYLIHPIWVQQLGVFSAQEVTTEIFSAFRRSIPYLMYDFNVNYLNYAVAADKVKCEKTNLIIPYSKNIGPIRKQYTTNTRRNITKANKCGLEIREASIDEFVALWQTENQSMRSDLHTTIRPLVEAAFKTRDAINCVSKVDIAEGNFTPHLFGVYREGRLVASLFGIQTRERFIYLIPVSNREGKECCAMFALVDHILETICCPQGLVFDCEGSMLEGVARFYRGFGAVEQPYASISRCRPEWLVRLMHR